MDEIVYLNELFDLYGELLSDTQKKYFRDYYFDNLSYGEIAEKYNISRNAIFKQLKNGTDKLNKLEKVIGLYSRKVKLRDIIKKIDDDNIKNELIELL